MNVSGPLWVTVDVTGCSACGGEHNGWLFARLSEPVKIGRRSYSYVAYCQKGEQAVYLRREDV